MTLGKMPSLRKDLYMKIKVKKLAHFKGELPAYQSKGSSGFDVRAQIETKMVLKPGERALVPTGLSFEIPEGFEIQARPRSGWAIKQGMTLLNTPGTIDADYRGEVKIILVNLGQEAIEILDQDRIAQLVICPIVQVSFDLQDSLSETERGAGLFTYSVGRFIS
jgi:dUTP pyrophosphatase